MFINTSFKSLNFDERPTSSHITQLIIHDTRMFSHTSVIDRLCLPSSKVSCHYVIARHGEIFKLVEESKRAWHAGESYWRGYSRLNDSSVGIELDNKGDEEFTNEQYVSLILLAKDIIMRHNIQPVNIIAHSDVAPNRKVDPNQHFSWLKLYEAGLGLYSIVNTQNNAVIVRYGDNAPEILKLKIDLNTLGYRIIHDDARFDLELLQVIYAYKKHYVPESVHHLSWDVLCAERLKDLKALASSLHPTL